MAEFVHQSGPMGCKRVGVLTHCKFKHRMARVLIHLSAILGSVMDEEYLILFGCSERHSLEIKNGVAAHTWGWTWDGRGVLSGRTPLETWMRIQAQPRHCIGKPHARGTTAVPGGPVALTIQNGPIRGWKQEPIRILLKKDETKCTVA